MSLEGSHKSHIVTLDGMRGIAALSVVILHLEQVFFDKHTFLHSYLAVDFFYCLSGFVIAYSYRSRLSGDMTFKDFMSRRIIRLYPLILLGVVIGTLSRMMHAVLSHGSIFMGLFYGLAAAFLFPIGLAFGDWPYPVDAPLWSIFFELLANVAFALIFGMRSAKVIIFLLVNAICLIAASMLFGGVRYLGSSLLIFPFICGLLRVAYPFWAGVLIFLISRRDDRKIPVLIPVALLLIVLLSPEHFGRYFDIFSVIVLIPLRSEFVPSPPNPWRP